LNGWLVGCLLVIIQLIWWIVFEYDSHKDTSSCFW
jgi:hypothetical protein